jgi:hypothetical protein
VDDLGTRLGEAESMFEVQFRSVFYLIYRRPRGSKRGSPRGGNPAVELERNVLTRFPIQFLKERLVVRFTEVEDKPRSQDDRSKCCNSEGELSCKILFYIPLVEIINKDEHEK